MPSRIGGPRLERVRASKQYKDGVFQNPSGASATMQGKTLPLIGEYFRSDVQRMPPITLPVERPHDVWPRRAETGLRATWLGHSTVLLELDGVRILTDPVLGERASPLIPVPGSSLNASPPNQA